MDKSIELDSVEKFYGDFHVLKGISFSIDKGSIFAYLGPNGAGKTTTIRILLGLLKPHSGNIRINASRKKIGFILENEDLSYRMDVENYLKFFAELYGVKWTKSIQLLESLELEGILKKPMSQLSKGLKKRVAFARALICEPEILFLDEPLEGFDPEWQVKFIEILKSLADKGTTVFITSHQLLYIERLATDFGIINNGRLLGQWKIKEVENLEKFYLEAIKNA